MNIQFSKEEQAIGGAVSTIIENAPVSVAKTGIGLVGTGLKLGWGIGKSLFGAAKVVGSATMEGIQELQAQAGQLQAGQLTPEQLEEIKTQLMAQMLAEAKANADKEAKAV